jgi:hypothetical protein
MEDSEFEKKIQENILENCGGLPIISVTQKPTDFGTNIRVGNVGASGFNMIRQILIGCYAAKTRFIISAEADCLYPPDYFAFRPERDDICYRNTNTYLMGYKRKCFWKKNEGGTWAQVINREFYIKRLEFLLKGEPKWDATKKNFPKEKGLKFFDEFETFETYFPCISIKTGKGMRKFSNSERVDIPELPYWGTGESIYNYYLK